MKLYGKNIDSACEYCRYGKLSSEKDVVLCVKKGIVSVGFSCSKFKYDPLKRIPKRRPPMPQYSPEDFEL